MSFVIRGRIQGMRQVQRALHAAPDEFRKSILGWLLTEQRMFVGGRKRGGGIRDGVFRKKLMRKKTLKGTPGWSKSVTRGAFKGYVSGGKKIDGMKLVMGSGLRKQNAFLEGIKILGSGGTISSPGKQMVLPVYRNLPQKKRTYEQFREMMNRKELAVVHKGGQSLYFKKGPQGEFSLLGNDLMFVGVRRVKIGKQFDFQGDWEKRIPKVIQRGQKKTDTIAKRINKKMSILG